MNNPASGAAGGAVDDQRDASTSLSTVSAAGPPLRRDHDEIAKRHAAIPQDGLFDPEPYVDTSKIKSKRSREVAADSGPRWSKIAPPKSSRPELCGRCVDECHRQGRTSAPLPARHRRRFQGEVLALCGPHAEPMKRADKQARIDGEAP